MSRFDRIPSSYSGRDSVTGRKRVGGDPINKIHPTLDQIDASFNPWLWEDEEDYLEGQEFEMEMKRKEHQEI